MRFRRVFRSLRAIGQNHFESALRVHKAIRTSDGHTLALCIEWLDGHTRAPPLNLLSPDDALGGRGQNRELGRIADAAPSIFSKFRVTARRASEEQLCFVFAP